MKVLCFCCDVQPMVGLLLRRDVCPRRRRIGCSGFVGRTNCLPLLMEDQGTYDCQVPGCSSQFRHANPGSLHAFLLQGVRPEVPRGVQDEQVSSIQTVGSSNSSFLQLGMILIAVSSAIYYALWLKSNNDGFFEMHHLGTSLPSLAYIVCKLVLLLQYSKVAAV